MSDLVPEIAANPQVWIRLGLRTKRPFMNFGDELSPLVLHEVLRSTIKWTPPSRADVVAIGSVVELVLRGAGHALVWGSGVRTPSQEVAQRAATLGPSRFVATRGPLSRDALGLPGSTPFGDPGVLAPWLMSGVRPQRRGRLLIPHFRTWASRRGRASIARMAASGFDVLEPSRPPLQVIEAIRRAEFVATTSLHGVIVAHATATPVQLLRADDIASEPSFKYRDYFLSIELPYHAESVSCFLERESILREQREAEVPAAEHRASILATRLANAMVARF